MAENMKKKWTPHIISVMAFVVFIVLGLACASQAPVPVPVPVPVQAKMYDLVDGNLPIHEGVTSIREREFSSKRITSVTIPDSVTTIGSYAFGDNPLTSITIGNDIGTLNENVFTGSLRNVTRISIGANVNLEEGYSDVVWSGFSSFY